MLIPPSPSYEVARLLIERVSDIGGKLSPSDLEWAIKMEDAFNARGFLTNKQLTVLINILVKHGEDTDG